MNYPVAVVLTIVAVGGLDMLVLRTRLLGRTGFWTAYVVVLFFQLIVNGLLAGIKIVRYDRSAILGPRFAFAPLEDLGFGFALVLATLSLWVWLGRRAARSTTHADRQAPPTRV